MFPCWLSCVFVLCLFLAQDTLFDENHTKRTPKMREMCQNTPNKYPLTSKQQNLKISSHQHHHCWLCVGREATFGRPTMVRKSIIIFERRCPPCRYLRARADGMGCTVYSSTNSATTVIGVESGGIRRGAHCRVGMLTLAKARRKKTVFWSFGGFLKVKQSALLKSFPGLEMTHVGLLWSLRIGQMGPNY